MRFVKTISFTTGGRFNSDKDDAEVNQVLHQVQQQGAEVLDIKVKLAGREMGATALYVIEYEASEPVR